MQKIRTHRGVCLSQQHPQGRKFSGELGNKPCNCSCSKGGLSSSLGLWERFFTLAFPLKMRNVWHKRAVGEQGLDFCHLRKKISKGSCQVRGDILCPCCHARCQRDIPVSLVTTASKTSAWLWIFQVSLCNCKTHSFVLFSLFVSLSFPPASLLYSCSPLSFLLLLL